MALQCLYNVFTACLCPASIFQKLSLQTPILFWKSSMLTAFPPQTRGQQLRYFKAEDCEVAVVVVCLQLPVPHMQLTLPKT